LKILAASGHSQRKLVLHSGDSLAGSRSAQVSSFRSFASYANTVCRIDAELRDDAKSLQEKIESRAAMPLHAHPAAGTIRPRLRLQFPFGL
jgi:hypothetical protein